MFNDILMGKNLNEAKLILVKNGISDITVINNDTRGDIKYDSTLVVKADIEEKKAKLFVSKFLLEI